MHRRSLLLAAVLFMLANPAFAQLSFTNQTQWLYHPDLASGLPIAVADVNGDGRDDVIRLDGGKVLHLDLQQADTAFAGRLVHTFTREQHALCAADINRDGRLDLLTGSREGGVTLLLSGSGGTYMPRHLPDSSFAVQGLNFADINLDGRADIFAAAGDDLSRWYRSLGGGSFSPDPVRLFPNNADSSLYGGNAAGVWTDFDADGDVDLYLSKTRLSPADSAAGITRNLLFVNQDGKSLQEQAAAYGLQLDGRSWAADFGDIDNDGDFDAYVINHDRPNQLLLNDNGQFVDITAEVFGPEALTGGRQCMFADFDNDTHLDLLLAGLEPGYRLYMNGGDGQSYQSFALPVLDIPTAAFGDLNSDGFLDIMAGQEPNANDQDTIPDRLFVNNGNLNGYLRVRLQGVLSTANGLGARLELYRNDVVQVREVRSGESHGIMNSLTAHFGTGTAAQADSLLVRWPSGIISRIAPVTLNRTLLLNEVANCLGEVGFQFVPDGLTFTFRSTSSVGDTARLWTFGDGTSSTERHPVHRYAEPGTYTVCLQASGVCGVGLECNVITVVCNDPIARFAYLIDGQQVTFQNKGTGAMRGTNLWSFGDGTTSTEVSPVHTYTGSGSFTVCLETTDECLINRQCHTIDIACFPLNAHFGVENDDLMAVFRDSSEGSIEAWFWEFGDGSTSDLRMPNHHYAEPGTYDVCLTVKSHCDSIRICQPIEINCAPLTTVITPLQDRLTFTFQATISGTYTSYSWSLGDGATSTEASPTHTYAQPGEYFVCLLIDSPCGDAQRCERIVVACDPPVGLFDIQADELSITVTDSTAGSDITYAYTFGDGASSSEHQPQHTYSQSGTYEVCQTLTNICGTSRICRQVTVSCPPTPPTFLYTASRQTLRFSNGSPTALSFSWDFGDGATSTEPDPVHVYADTGSYVVCLTTTDQCGQAQVCDTIQVNCVAPEAFFSISVDGRSVSLTAASGTDTLQPRWTFGDGSSSTEVNPVHLYAGSGTYEICLEVSNECDTVRTCRNVNLNCPVPQADFSLVTDQLSVNLIAIGANADTVLWTLGDGNTSSQRDLRHTYAQNGTYEVCLQLANQCGRDTFCRTAIIDCPRPTPSFTRNILELRVSFTNTSAVSGQQIRWLFGDGSSSTVNNPEHTYAKPGSYSVCLRITNPCGEEETCSQVTVSCAAPSAKFTYKLADLTVNLRAPSARAGTTWSWDFGDGAKSTQANPSHAFATPGQYQVCLTGSNMCGQNTVCQNVTVNCAPPQSRFGFVANELQISFADSSSNGATAWVWTFGDGGTSSEQNPVHTYQASGRYEVCLTSSSICGPDRVCLMIDVSCAAPAPAFGFMSTERTISFADSSGNDPTAWAWTFGDGDTSSLQNPAHTYALPGQYLVCLRVSSHCGEEQLCQTIQVTCAAPQAAFNVDSTRLEVAFEDISTNAPAEWAWNFGDNTTSTEQSPQHIYALPGTYTVCLTVSNICGATQRCQQVTVRCPVPQSAFSFTREDLSVNFKSEATDEPEFFQWTFGDGATSTAADPVHTYTQPGNYQVCLIAGSSCGQTQACRTLLVSCTPPQAVFNVQVNGLEVTVQDASQGQPEEWHWTFGDGGVSGEQNPEYTYAVGGTYNICLRVAGLCGETTACRMVSVSPTAASEPAWAARLLLAPNPATEQTRLSWHDLPGSQTTVCLLAVTGQELARKTFQGSVGEWHLDLPGLPAGVYLLQIRNEGRPVYRRLVVQ